MCTKIIRMFEVWSLICLWCLSMQTLMPNKGHKYGVFTCFLLIFLSMQNPEFHPKACRHGQPSFLSICCYLQDHSVWQEQGQAVMSPPCRWHLHRLTTFQSTFHLIIFELSFHVEVMRGKQRAIKLVKLKMIFYTEANKGSYFPAEDVTFASFCSFLL